MKPISNLKRATRVPKKMVCIRLDMDVLQWFKRRGPRYQTLVQKVLRHYKDREESAEWKNRIG